MSVRAFDLLSKRFGEAHLLLIGGGPWYPQGQAMVDALGLQERVHFTGYLPRTEAFDCLAESDVFGFSSLTDTQGVAVLEAMALGCPAVVVRSGAVEDVVRHEVDGLIVQASAEQMSEGLATVLENDDFRAKLAGNARRRAEEFTAGRMAERLVQVYRKLLDG